MLYTNKLSSFPLAIVFKSDAPLNWTRGNNKPWLEEKRSKIEELLGADVPIPTCAIKFEPNKRSTPNNIILHIFFFFVKLSLIFKVLKKKTSNKKKT